MYTASAPPSRKLLRAKFGIFTTCTPLYEVRNQYVHMQIEKYLLCSSFELEEVPQYFTYVMIDSSIMYLSKASAPILTNSEQFCKISRKNFKESRFKQFVASFRTEMRDPSL